MKLAATPAVTPNATPPTIPRSTLTVTPNETPSATPVANPVVTPTTIAALRSSASRAGGLAAEPISNGPPSHANDHTKIPPAIPPAIPAPTPIPTPTSSPTTVPATITTGASAQVTDNRTTRPRPYSRSDGKNWDRLSLERTRPGQWMSMNPEQWQKQREARSGCRSPASAPVSSGSCCTRSSPPPDHAGPLGGTRQGGARAATDLPYERKHPTMRQRNYPRIEATPMRG